MSTSSRRGAKGCAPAGGWGRSRLLPLLVGLTSSCNQLLDIESARLGCVSDVDCAERETCSDQVCAPLQGGGEGAGSSDAGGVRDAGGGTPLVPSGASDLSVDSGGGGDGLVDDGDAGAALPPECEPGEVACADPRTLGTCIDGRLRESEVCAPGSVCAVIEESPAACVPVREICVGREPLETFCDGSRRVACSEDLLYAEVVECQSEAHCQAGEGVDCASCLPGSFRCDSRVLSRCRDDLSDFEVVDQCESAALCDASSGRCEAPACAAGSYLCQGDVLGTCNRDLTGYDPVAECASAALCDREASICRAPPCNSGSFVCEGAVLQACNDDLTAYEPRDTCDSPALCDPGARACRARACSQGDFRCEGNVLLACRDDLTGFQFRDTCASPDLCDEGAGECEQSSCEAGERRCSGATLLRCNDSLSGFEPEATCASAVLCDPTSGCGAAACDAGEHRCDGAVLLECNQDRTGFSAVATCPSAGLCDATLGGCGTAACTQGEFRCSGSTLLECAPDLTELRQVDVCAAAALCDAAAGECDVCEPRTLRCVSSTVQAACSSDGQTETERRCPRATPFCVSARCVECASATDCPASTGTCRTPVCSNGSCSERIVCLEPVQLDPNVAIRPIEP